MFRLNRPLLAAGSAAALLSHREARSEPQTVFIRDRTGRTLRVTPEQGRLLLTSQAAQQSQLLLAEPPAALRRFGDAWRRHASPSTLTVLERTRNALRAELSKVQQLESAASLRNPLVSSLNKAVDDAEAAVRAVRGDAAERAGAVPWGQLMRGVRLEGALAGSTGGSVSACEALRGKVVALYFTASWCGPCRRFSPALVELYGEADAAAKDSGAQHLQVVLVSWDESESDLRDYARSVRMPWLALPFAERGLVDELSLRYRVGSIPTLVVLEVSQDGSEATILSEEGRMETLGWLQTGGGPATRQAPEWLRRIGLAAPSPGG